MTWQDAVQDKRDRLAKTFPQEWLLKAADTGGVSPYDWIRSDENTLLSKQEKAIVNSSAVDLLEKLRTQQLSSVDVTTAFCKQTALAHQLVNCCCEFFPEEALARAKELDDHLAKTGQPVGPLHGLPISLKDQMRIKGLETTMGYASYLGKFDSQDSVIVKLLRSAGAVFYTKTNVPQTLMVCETINNVFGRTLNPRNTAWSCGGSSGGEGALVGIRGAVLGVGTDIGGSIRVPSAFNFLYGIRPSHGRLPYANLANSMEGQETVHSVVGPIGHSVDDISLFCQAVLSQNPWAFDPKVIPMPWDSSKAQDARTRADGSGLVLGYYDYDGNIMPHPPIRRGVKTAVDAMKKAGHHIFQWEPYKHEYGWNMMNQIYVADGSEDVMKDIKASGEPVIPNISDLLNPDIKPATVTQVWDTQLAKWNYQIEYLAYWRSVEEKLGREVDAIIAPITPSAAIRHNQFKYYGYATVINLLDYTSVIVPVTFADRAKDPVDSGFKPRSDLDKTVQQEYDPDAYHGAPVAVQVIGKRLSEEKTLEIARHLGARLDNEIVS